VGVAEYRKLFEVYGEACKHRLSAHQQGNAFIDDNKDIPILITLMGSIRLRSSSGEEPAGKVDDPRDAESGTQSKSAQHVTGQESAGVSRKGVARRFWWTR